MEISSFLRLVRWRNLALIIVLQGLVAFRLYQACNAGYGGCSLDIPGVLLLILTTLLVTAAGYVVNDIRDVDIDLVNRPGKVVVGNVISKRAGWEIYVSLVCAGVAAATGLVLNFDQIIYLPGFFLATGLLLSYSVWWKKSFLGGNILVSLMCGVAVFVFLIPDLGHEVLESGNPSLLNIMIGLMWFAAIMTLYREIVKDLEDMEGDRIASAHTLPLRLGKRKAIVIGTAVGSLAVLSLAIWLAWSWKVVPTMLNAGVLLISLMMVHNMILLARSDSQGQLHFISQYIKVIMLVGIIVFLLY